MSELERRSFEHTLAVHSAPALLGIKCANLISAAIDASDICDYRQEFESRSNLQMRVLCQCHERQLLYVYHETLLAMQLSQPEIRAFLTQYGYTEDMNLQQMLGTLASRMLCGCWKVYSDPESARRTFANYDRCREILCDKLQQGCEFFRALELSKEELL